VQTTASSGVELSYHKGEVCFVYPRNKQQVDVLENRTSIDRAETVDLRIHRADAGHLSQLEVYEKEKLDSRIHTGMIRYYER
jgi:hypothetical protein